MPPRPTCDHPHESRYALYRRAAASKRGNRAFETDGSRCGAILEPAEWKEASEVEQRARDDMARARRRGKAAPKRATATWAAAAERRRAAECGVAFPSTVTTDTPRKKTQR